MPILKNTFGWSDILQTGNDHYSKLDLGFLVATAVPLMFSSHSVSPLFKPISNNQPQYEISGNSWFVQCNVKSVNNVTINGLTPLVL
jgi:hypothetical protein